ncbi:oligopeptide transport ATP-binding protein OppD [Geobacter sp. OR-1]|uniref:ABC transporter ATP-binding protein n=1 Tax=Geobacter sp. OR-1 TaxID=1266765 RepID=UPI000541BCA9|nr:ABC transporter ATP-binding protein [Geobacter sp. OR-1]GAM11135.1 oligopeptide transport ATP-binding protein OppD [Geobacter sp. OR-1]
MTAAGRHLLSVESLSVRIPGRKGELHAVNQVSFSLESGRTLAVVGESGSGKSMFCRAILGILPTGATMGGEVSFAGTRLSGLCRRELDAVRGKEIGVVLQNPMSSLNPTMKIGRQVAEPMLRHLGMSGSEAAARSLELLAAVGIPGPAEKAGSYPHQLSGGMRQRVAIAMALSCDPRLLIADEPTTALDVTVQAEVLNLLARLQRERNMAMILVTHDLGVVAGMAHDTAVMYAGEIVEQAETTELFARMRMPYTRALFDAIPRIDAPPHTELAAIGGAPPDLAALPAGCRFAPRCRYAQERCRAEEPPLINDWSEGHRYACWFPLPVGGRP